MPPGTKKLFIAYIYNRDIKLFKRPLIFPEELLKTSVPKVAPKPYIYSIQTFF